MSTLGHVNGPDDLPVGQGAGSHARRCQMSRVVLCMFSIAVVVSTAVPEAQLGIQRGVGRRCSVRNGWSRS